MDQRQLSFRKYLFRLGEKLTSQDLDSLIFICRGTLRASRLDRVRSGTELFQALSERGKLSADNLTYLSQILASIGRENLLSDLEGAGFLTSPSPKSSNKDYMFQECLVKIAQDLTSLDVEKASFVLGPSLGNLDPQKVFSATQLFQILQQRQFITVDDLRILYDALMEIGRKDATSHINVYLQSINRSGYLPAEAVNNGVTRREEQYNVPIPPAMNPPTPSSGVASYFGQQQCSITSAGDTLLDLSGHGHADRGHSSMSESESGGTAELAVIRSPTEVRPSEINGDVKVLPFGLRFDVFEEQELNQESKLLQSLSVKEGELRYKERELQRLQKELGEQMDVREKMMLQRAEDREVYSQSVQDLQTVLSVKNQEVASLVQELQHLHQQMATMQAATPVREEDLYAMDRQPHGICLIFNNYEFHHPEDMEKANPSRGGANIDQYNLTQTFKYLRYDVVVHENLTAQGMQDTMMYMASRDHKLYDSFVCCILTHGETNVVHGADSREVNLLEFAATAKLCPTLRGKPKMFFVQACRGEAEQTGLDIERDTGGNQAPPTVTATIPQEADFFFGYATPTGNAAYRSKRHGSWYISELCKVFAQHGYTHNLSSMMKKVNNQVSKAYTKEGYKQCPEFVDRLRKEVHFFHFLKGQL